MEKKLEASVMEKIERLEKGAIGVQSEATVLKERAESINSAMKEMDNGLKSINADEQKGKTDENQQKMLNEHSLFYLEVYNRRELALSWLP